MAFFTLVQKNIKVLLRSKSSALVILLGPFFIIFLLGIAFNSTGLHSVRIAVYAEQYTPLADTLLGELTKNEFIILKSTSEEHCIALVREGGAHLCIKLPILSNTDNSDDVNGAGDTSGTGTTAALEQASREILFHVDYSKVNLVFTILSVISHEVESISSDLSLEYTKALIEMMNSTATEIEGKVSVIESLKGNAVTMKDSLVTMHQQLEAMAIDTSSFGLDGADAQLSQSQQELQQFKQLSGGAITSGLQLLDGVELYLEGFEQTLQEQVDDLHGFQSTIGGYANLVCNIDFTGMPDLSFDPCGDLTNIQGFIEGVIAESDRLSSDFDRIREQIDDARGTLRSTGQGQTEILSQASTQLTGLGQQLNNAQDRVKTLEEQRNMMVAQLTELIALLDQNILTIDAIKDEVASVAATIKEARLDSAEEIVNPLLTRIKPVVQKKSYFDYTLPSLIVLVLMFMSILLSTTMVMNEKSSKAYFRNYITPTRSTVFFLSIYITNLMIVLLQGVLLLLIAQLGFNVTLFAQFVPLVISLLLISSVFILLGMAIGYLFSSEETATLAAISLSSIFLLFSSFLIPLESLAKNVSAIAQFNPFVLGENTLRGLLIFQREFTLADANVQLLILYVVAAFILLYLCEYIDKRRLK